MHGTENASKNNNNNNTTNVNNNQKSKRQYSLSEDGPTISEDDLDNLINQHINKWQQLQKSNSDTEKGTTDIDLTPSASIIS